MDHSENQNFIIVGTKKPITIVPCFRFVINKGIIEDVYWRIRRCMSVRMISYVYAVTGKVTLCVGLVLTVQSHGDTSTYHLIRQYQYAGA